MSIAKKLTALNVPKPIVFIGITILSILINGYKFNSTDLSLYLSYLPLYEGQNPYHPNDLILIAQNTGSHYYTFGMYLLIPFYHLLTLPWTLFLIHAICLYFIFVTFFRLAETIWDTPTAWIAVTLLIAKKMVAGAPVGTLEDTFSVRSMALPILFVAIRYFLNKNYFLSFFLIGLAGNFHLLSSCILFGILFFPLLWEHKRNGYKNYYAFGIFLLSLSPIIVWRYRHIVLGNSIIPLHLDPEWLRIVHIRASYLFPFQWDTESWIYLLVLGMTMLVLHQQRNKLGGSKQFIFITYSSIIISVIVMIASQLNFPIAISFQLIRAVWFMFYFILLWIARYIYILYQEDITAKRNLANLLFLTYFVPLARLGVIFSILPIMGNYIKNQNRFLQQIVVKQFNLILVLVVIVGGSFLYFRRGLPRIEAKIIKLAHFHIDIQGKEAGDDWIDIQKWVNQNTPEHCLIITPPDKTGFRVWSGRSPLVENKDGTMSVYNIDYAKNWLNRMRDLQIQPQQDTKEYAIIYDQLPESVIYNLSTKYGASYIVKRKTGTLSFPLLYENSSFMIYHIPS